MKQVERKGKGILRFIITLAFVVGIFTGIVPETSMIAKADGTHTHNDITFTEWTSTTGLPTSSGNYYLANDVTISSTWSVPSGTTNLCLNGHGIIMTGSARVITIGSGSTLNLYDCDTSTTHHYTISNPAPNGAGLAVVDSTGNKSFTGGYITGGVTNSGSNSGSGACVRCENGNFNMYGGTIIGNQEKASGSSGGGIASFGGCIKIYGGSVIGNYAVSAAGLYFNGGQHYIYGGVFKFNKATDVGCANIQNTQILGGVFTNNYETGGYGVIISSATYGGNVIIKDNQTGDKIQNVAREGSGLKIVEPLTNTDPIGVFWKPGNIGTGKVFTSSENTDYNDPTKFKSDDPDYTVIKNADGQLALVPLCSVTYDGNGNTGGSVPTDTNSPYAYGSTVTVCGNTGSLVKSGYTFEGWNTKEDGTGTTYAANATFTVSADITLYAKWAAIPATAPTINSVSSLTGINALTYGYTSGSISVSATPANGHTITDYQWYDRGTTNSNSGGTQISGATSATYNIPTGKDAGTYYYYCVVTTKRTDNNQTTTATSGVATVTINKRSITITAKAQTITYGGSITTGTGQVTTATLASEDSLTAITLTPSTNVAITNGTITPGAATIKKGSTDVTSNYSITYATGELTINKASLTVTAKSKIITYGDTPANDGVTYSGFVNSETSSILGGSLSYAYNYSQYGDIGSYTITPGGLTSSNYDISFVAGTLTVNQKEVGLTWTNTSLTYNSSSQIPTATATELVNNDSISVTVTGEQTNAGDYTATASALIGEKANNYKLPSGKTQGFSINKKNVTVSGITACNKVYNRSTTATINTDNASFDGLLDGDALTVSATGTFDNMNVGTGKTVTISNLALGGTSAGNYQLADSGQQASTTADITAKALAVTAEAKTKVYGTDDPALTYTYDGLINGDSFTGALTREEGSDVGTYAIAQGTLTAGGNYAITYTGANLTITQATPVITGISANDLTYDKTEQALVTTGSTTGGTLKYAMTAKNAEAPDDDSYIDSVPTAIYAGT